MSSLAVSIESVIAESETVAIEAAALLVKKSYRSSVDTALTYMGLESTTCMTQEISQEGIFNWIGKRLSGLSKKLTLTINKIYAKITNADNTTKDLIKRAEGGEDVKLPISGAKAAAIIAGGVVVVTAIGFFGGCAAKGVLDDRKAKKIDAELKKHMDLVRQKNEAMGSTYPGMRDDIRRETNTLLKAPRDRHAELIRDKRRQRAEIRERQKRGYKGLIGDSAKSFLKSLSAILGKISGAFKGVFGNLTNLFRKSENASYQKSDNGKSADFLKRLSVVGKSMAGMFKTFWTWFKANWRGAINAADQLRKMAKEFRMRR